MQKLNTKSWKDFEEKQFNLLKWFFNKFNVELKSLNISFYSIKLTFTINNIEEVIFLYKNDFYFVHKNCFSLSEWKEVSFFLSNNEWILSKIIKSSFEKLLLNFFSQKRFKRESSFLEKFQKKDNTSKWKILIYSEEKYLKPLKYLFYYNKFKNLVFYSEENQCKDIVWKYEKIIILWEPESHLLNTFIKDKKIKYKKIIFLWDISNDLYRFKNLEEILLNEENLEIISNCYKNEKLENKRNKKSAVKTIDLSQEFEKCFQKFNFKFVNDFDLFWNIENSLLLNEEKIDTDILISIWWGNRDMKIVYENLEFLKNYNCVLFNTKDLDNPKDPENEKNMKMFNEIKKCKNFKIFERFSEEDYRKNIINSKVILVPSTLNFVTNWRSYTWWDIMMLGKYCLIWKTNRLLDFHKYNKYWAPNFDYYENSNDLIWKLRLVLDNDEYRRKIEKHAFSSYIKDLSIERILYKII